MKPIGVFDSGYGGLTVLKEIQQLLPQYDYIYLGDNARAPYGELSQELVFKYTWEGVTALFEQGCDLVILACNTASAKALRKIQQTKLIDYPTKRVLGVIRPSAESVGNYSLKNEIVVLGTRGTIRSNTYVDEFEEHSPVPTIVNQYACPLWVPIIEKREYLTPNGIHTIQQDLHAIEEKFPQADVYLLGCTHYPIIKELIENTIPTSIKVISQGEIVATSLKEYLKRHSWLSNNLSQTATSIYLTSGNHFQFQKHASEIIGISVQAQHFAI